MVTSSFNVSVALQARYSSMKRVAVSSLEWVSSTVLFFSSFFDIFSIFSFSTMSGSQGGFQTLKASLASVPGCTSALWALVRTWLGSGSAVEFLVVLGGIGNMCSRVNFELGINLSLKETWDWMWKIRDKWVSMDFLDVSPLGRAWGRSLYQIQVTVGQSKNCCIKYKQLRCPCQWVRVVWSVVTVAESF